jgi:phosphoribosyl 1,2-cyclic phosphodiesterase
MRFASLGSGSRGNATLVCKKHTHILLDCGFSLRETLFRLARLGLEPEDLDGIVVTHEHGDHSSGVVALCRRYGLRVWMTPGTLAALPAADGDGLLVEHIEGDAPFEIGELELQPFPVPHDAREPCQFVFSDGSRRLGVFTDTGCSTPHVERVLSGCEGLVLECNHDLEMLADCGYPPSLKRRIGGRYGHLDNGAAAALLAAIDTRRLQHIVAAHLSEQNNRPELAQRALANALGCETHWVSVAGQDGGLTWRELL